MLSCYHVSKTYHTVALFLFVHFAYLIPALFAHLTSINSFPGIGKLTIARALFTLLGGEHPARLVDNHLLIDPASAALPRTSPNYQPLRKAIRTAVLNAITLDQDSHKYIYIFTDFQSDNDLGRCVCEEYQTTARSRNCAFVPIILTCSKEEHMKRVVMSDRKVLGRSKLMDATLVAEMRMRSEIYTFGVSEELTVDTTNQTPEVAAKVIWEHLKKLGVLD